MRRRVLLGALAALALLPGLAAGCGEKQEAIRVAPARQFALILDDTPTANDAGIYTAEANGRFTQAGLDVQIHQPQDPQTPVKDVGAGRVDLAIAGEAEVLRARSQGLHVVSVAALVQRPLAAVISLPEAKIHRPSDLAGKRVATAGLDYQSAFLHTILSQAGANPASAHELNGGPNPAAALATHKADAIVGGSWNYDALDMRLHGQTPQVIPVDSAGVPTYDEWVLVANTDALAKDSGLVRRFIAGLAGGTSDLERDPDAGVTALVQANPELDPRLQRESVKATLPAFEPPPGRPYGYQDPGEWNSFANWMRQSGLLAQPIVGTQALRNDLLPGQGP